MVRKPRTESIEVFSTTSNMAVVRTPGRQFPGCVVQGDSLAALVGLSEKIAQRVRDAQLQDGELLGSVQELHEQLLGRLLHYQAVLDEHGVPLPYGQRRSAGDLVR